MSDEYVQDVLDFENSSTLAPATKPVLNFARNVAFGYATTEEDFAELRKFGFSDRAVVEIVSMALLESGMARHATGVAPFEDGSDWPKDNLPSSVYGENVNA